MRFSVAVGALLSQTLPSTIRAKVSNQFETTLFETHSERSKHFVKNRSRNTFPKVRTSKVNLKSRLASLLKKNEQYGAYALRNSHSISLPDGVECDPFSSSTSANPDVGILKCSDGTLCKVDETSSLGGICTPTLLSNRHLLEEDIFQSLYLEMCNEKSDFFIEDLNCTATCDDFDPETSVGSFSCTDGCLPYICQDACMGYESNFFATGPDDYNYESCYFITGPDGGKSMCYGITVAGGSNGTLACTASWNGVDCDCTYGSVSTVNCPDGQSSINGTVEYLVNTFLEMNACVPDEDNVCQTSCSGVDQTPESPGNQPPDSPGDDQTTDSPGDDQTTDSPGDDQTTDSSEDGAFGSIMGNKIFTLALSLSSMVIAFSFL